jgi:hypothetical protein
MWGNSQELELGKTKINSRWAKAISRKMGENGNVSAYNVPGAPMETRNQSSLFKIPLS